MLVSEASSFSGVTGNNMNIADLTGIGYLPLPIDYIVTAIRLQELM